MRESTGSAVSFQIIVLFLLIFTAFLIIVINYSRAYLVKNDMISIIEKYEGIGDESKEIINSYIKAKGYKAKGECPSGWFGVSNIDNSGEKDDDGKTAVDGKKYYYCYKESKVEKIYAESKEKNDYYYTEIRLFFKFDLPVVGDILSFKVNGKTSLYKGYNKTINKGYN